MFATSPCCINVLVGIVYEEKKTTVHTCFNVIAPNLCMLFFVQMMSHLMAVKDKQTIADNMFEPLKATIELLKTYGQELSDDVHLQVQVIT